MITYKSLEALSNACLELLRYTSGLREKEKGSLKKAHENILGAVRKIIIANEMMGRGVICVSGLQGAGKSTLIKNFYDLDEKSVNITLGRGERIPIFISEKRDCKKPELYGVCLEKKENDEYKREYIKLEPEQFRKASTGDKQEIQAMYLEIKVPYKHFCNESFTFMLLPGFEKKNDYWQSLIDFSVKCSDSSIFVFDESSFARNDNQKLLEKIQDKFKVSLIYALSHSDQRADGNKALKDTCMKDMKIPSDEADRVVCVGQYGEKARNEEWIAQLKDAIERYCNSIETAHEQCNKYIYDLIENDIRPGLETIRSCIEEDMGDIIIELENSKYLKAFDKIVEKRKKTLSKELDRQLKEASGRSCLRLEGLFDKKDIGRAIRRTVFGENIKDIQLTRERINESLKSEEGYFEFQKAFVEAITITTNTLINDNEGRTILLEDNQPKLPSVFGEEKGKLTENILHDAKVLLAPRGRELVALKHEDSVEVMKVIADLSIGHFGLQTLEDAGRRFAVQADTTVEKLQISVEDVTAKIGKVDQVILGTLGITGIDLMQDGVLNAVPAIAEALGVSVPAVGLVVGAIGLVTTGAALINDTNRIQRAEYEYAKKAIGDIQEEVKTEYLSAYDDAMEKVRERLESNLIALSGKNRREYKKISALAVLNRIETLLESILSDVLWRDQYALGNAFGK